jgi:hypothetical protein
MKWRRRFKAFEEKIEASRITKSPKTRSVTGFGDTSISRNAVAGFGSL